jgi:hypothetical protein
MKTKKSSTATLSTMLSDCQMKALYPLVSYRIIPLVDLADVVGMTPGALRKAAQRLGVTDNATEPYNTIAFLKRILRYSYENGTDVTDYVNDVMTHNIDF